MLLPHCEFVNLYGSSEVGADSTCYRSDGSEVHCVPIGRPLINTSVYVLDADMQPVPLGAHGELYIAGRGLARGYLHQPALTAERFLPCPFRSGERMYRTGDRARLLPDGNLEFLGRVDHQVKIRGQRIELREIEAALIDHAYIKDSVVAIRPDAQGEDSLVCYLVPQPHKDLELSEVRQHLKQRLPEYMIPGSFVRLEQLPLTPSGKVDRQRLPAPDVGPANESPVPRNQLETALAVAWCKMLKLPQVGIDQNFFELGGHSLLAVHMIFEMRRVMAVKLPASILFQRPTIRQLAQYLTSNCALPPELSADAETGVI
jgi:hypothetical protein